MQNTSGNHQIVQKIVQAFLFWEKQKTGDGEGEQVSSGCCIHPSCATPPPAWGKLDAHFSSFR